MKEWLKHIHFERKHIINLVTLVNLSKKEELYPVEYRDILNNYLVKLTPSTSSSNHRYVITLKEGEGEFP